MLRTIVILFLSGMVLMTTACAQSIHQTDRASTYSLVDGGYPDAQYWGGPGYWWNPFGYYGSRYGWLGRSPGGGWHRGAHHHASPSSPPPTPPANAPPQFKKSP
jgi:hypothetical protein